MIIVIEDIDDQDAINEAHEFADRVGAYVENDN